MSFRMWSMLLAVIACSCMARVAGATSPVLLWVEGDPPKWTDIEHWVTGGGGSSLPTGEMVIRLIDPQAASGNGTPWDLTNHMQTQVIACIKGLRDGGFTGPIHMLPYFGDGPWRWQPASGAVTQPWEAPFQWVRQANELLSQHGVSPGLTGIVLESEDSAGVIQVDDSSLLAMQQFQASLWPTLSQNPAFVAMSATRAFSAAIDGIRWTTSTASAAGDQSYFQAPPLRRVMLQCYNMIKLCTVGGSEVNFVDAYASSASFPNPMPVAPETIYTNAATTTNPASTVLGTPTLNCPDAVDPSNFGFLLGNKTPPASMAGHDLSGLTFMFSIESVSANKGIIDAFGTWDGQSGRAGVTDFTAFLASFTSTFMTWWNNGTPPPAAHHAGLGIYTSDSVSVPASWWTGGPPCSADLVADGQVNADDLLSLVQAWGTSEGDVDGDGDTDVQDMLAVLRDWGQCG